MESARQQVVCVYTEHVISLPTVYVWWWFRRRMWRFLRLLIAESHFSPQEGRPANAGRLFFMNQKSAPSELGFLAYPSGSISTRT